MRPAVFRWSGFAVGGIAAAFSHTADASGFALAEQNTSALGNSYAGAAASAEDASTIFFNAAGMTKLDEPAIAVSAIGIDIRSEFHNTASQAALGQTLGNEGGDAGGTSMVPAAYFAMPVGMMRFGLGVNAPFGLKTEYDSSWMGRFQAVKSEVKTINVNPSFAFKFSEAFSLGIGADYQTIDAELTSAINYTALVAQVSPALVSASAGLQGATKVEGDDSAWGWDIGALLTPVEGTRVGVSYRAAIKYHVTGNATSTAPASGNVQVAGIIAAARAGALADGPVVLDIELPASARVSLTHDLGDAFELLADVQWTEWSSIQELRVKRPDGTTLSLTPEAWENTWRYALGANFRLNDAWKLRGGVAYDEAPVPDATRTPRLPDGDRKWVSVGAQWRLSESMKLDASYAHLFVSDAGLDQNAGSTSAYGLLNGEQRSNINILGVQLSVNF